MKAKILITFILLTSCIAYGQNRKTIEIDPITDMAKESLPFDQDFVLKKTFNDSISIYFIGYFEIKQKERKTYFNLSKSPTDTLEYKLVKNEKEFDLYIFVPPLKPQKAYDFIVIQNIESADPLMNDYLQLFKAFNESKDSNEIKKNIKSINLKKRKNFDAFELFDLTVDPPQINYAGLQKFYQDNLKTIYNDTSKTEEEKTKEIKNKIAENDLFKKSVSFSATSEIFSFETRAKFRITPDFGYVGYGFQKGFNGFTPYLGFQIEFRYFDKNIPFKLIPNKTIWHRLSFNTGITLASLKKEGQREDLFKDKSLLIGLGLRLSNALRITGGAILFNREDPNPLIDNKQLGITPFVGLSIDLSLKQLLNEVSELIPLNRN